jgi:hypothetical protein
VRRLGTDGAAENRGGAAVMAYRREAAVGAQTNRREMSSFIAAHCVGATRAYARAARCSSDVTVVATLCGGDVEGICPYAIGSGELARGWHWTGPRSAHGCASAWCLHDAWLGSWRLDDHTRCQQGRMKQRRCARPCHRVLGAGIMAAQRP